MIHIPTRLPHDVIVEEGLPPNPGPPSSRSLEEPDEKRRRQQRHAEEDGAEEDYGSTPGYYKHGKREDEGSQREEGQGKKIKLTQSSFENAETPFGDTKNKR